MKAPATQFAATRGHSCNERDSAPGAGVRGIEDFQPASPEVERSPSRDSLRVALKWSWQHADYASKRIGSEWPTILTGQIDSFPSRRFPRVDPRL